MYVVFLPLADYGCRARVLLLLLASCLFTGHFLSHHVPAPCFWVTLYHYRCSWFVSGRAAIACSLASRHVRYMAAISLFSFVSAFVSLSLSPSCHADVGCRFPATYSRYFKVSPCVHKPSLLCSHYLCLALFHPVTEVSAWNRSSFCSFSFV